MIDFYTWGTPNGRKVSIMLEEIGLDYTVHTVDITADEQFDPAFLAISPNNKIPAIVDHDGIGGRKMTLFESGAILIYLANKTKTGLFPSDTAERYETLQWLMFQMGGVGPMFGQANHFLHFLKEDVPYAQNRYRTETHRLYGVMDRRLADNAYLAGGAYTIADIATYPWVMRWNWHEIDLPKQCPNVWRWVETIGARPAVERGMAVPA
ncbi:MAG: glutathione S-transferase N-terminal domain-containing protein [Rhodospirillales bacterium]